VMIKQLLLAGAVALATMCGAQAEPNRGGVITMATIGEPPTLDPMTSTADLVGIITQHIFETLFTFDQNWTVVPLVAAAMPEVSEDGTVYTIKVREGVTFHDGSTLDAGDVVASLRRWTEIASRGRLAAENIASIDKVDD